MTDFAAQFARTNAAYEQGLITGEHLGAQFYLWRAGQVLADVGLGECAPGRPMTPDTIMPWLSSGKPITAAAILQLWERRKLDLDASVGRYIPEFGQRGKEAITVRQLLTHTGGFRLAAIQERDLPHQDVLDRIYAMKLERDWTPGAKAGYHAETSWYVLGELVRRLDGRPHSVYVREELFLPLGMNHSWLGMTATERDQLAPRLGLMYDTARGADDAPARFRKHLEPEVSPGAGACGPMHDLGRFYRMLLAGGELNGRRALRRETVNLMTSRQREGLFDQTFRATIDWGLGLIIDSKRYGADSPPYGYGCYASDRTFGHSGNQSSAAFADPACDLVVAVVFNGMPGEAAHQRRMQQTLEAVYQDLGLAN